MPSQTSINELANQLGLTAPQIRHAIKTKAIPQPKKRGFQKTSPYYFTEEQVEEIRNILNNSK